MSALRLQDGLLPQPVRLTDGKMVLVRPLRIDDGARLVRLYKRLSPDTVYRRFMVANPKLNEASLARLTDVDHQDREALVVALHGEIHGVARYHRRPDQSGAEIAVVVEDRWQGRGIGRVLFTRLAELARLRGVEAFSGTMLAENTKAVRLLLSVFPNAERRIHQGELEFRIPLQAGSISVA